MKWDNWIVRRGRKMKWHRWFAWHPVTLGNEWHNPEGQTVWLEWVERRTTDNIEPLTYIYRQN